MYLLWQDYVIDYEIHQELVGIFTTREKAEDVIKFFNMSGNPKIEEYEKFDRFDFIDFTKKPYFLTKDINSDKIDVRKEDAYCFSEIDKVFDVGVDPYSSKYFYTLANSEEEAIDKFKKLL